MKKILSLIFFIISMKLSFSQMIYTDFEPDIDFHNINYPYSFLLDIDNNGITEIEIISITHPDYGGTSIDFYGNNLEFGLVNYDEFLIFETSKLINENSGWEYYCTPCYENHA